MYIFKCITHCTLCKLCVTRRYLCSHAEIQGLRGIYGLATLPGQAVFGYPGRLTSPWQIQFGVETQGDD